MGMQLSCLSGGCRFVPYHRLLAAKHMGRFLFDIFVVRGGIIFYCYFVVFMLPLLTGNAQLIVCCLSEKKQAHGSAVIVYPNTPSSEGYWLTI